MDSPILISGLLGGLLGSAVTALINHLVRWRDGRDKIASVKKVLAVEVDICAEFARTYRSAGIAAPLYRLPTSSFNTALRELLEVGAVSASAANSLMKFYVEVESLNRGLDRISEKVRADVAVPAESEAGREFDRNKMKAEHVMAATANMAEGALFTAAKEALKASN